MRTPRRYHVDQRRKQKKRRILKSIMVTAVLLVVAGGVLFWDMKRSQQDGEVIGVSRSVEQQEDAQATTNLLLVDEPFFSMKIAEGWKEVARRSDAVEQSITWQSTIKGEDNRWLKLYYDVIPKDVDFNRLLPLDVVGGTLAYRQISDNCKNFTTAQQGNNAPQPSRWDNVDFICDLASFNDNRVGTGIQGALNATSVTGDRQGTHKYLFEYIDRNIQPDYTIFYNALKSFQAK